jgi:hypothetical protein
MFTGNTGGLFCQIGKMTAENTGPDNIYLKYIDIGGASGQQLLIKRQSFGG